MTQLSSLSAVDGYTLVMWRKQIEMWRLSEKQAAYQCKRSACKKADKPSMMRRIATVSTAKAQKITERKIKPNRLWVPRPSRITMDQSTSDNSEERRQMARSGIGGKFLLCAVLLKWHMWWPATGWRHWSWCHRSLVEVRVLSCLVTTTPTPN